PPCSPLFVWVVPRCRRSMLFFFFFQAEDGIRDRNVTGVQTCALPISQWNQCHRKPCRQRANNNTEQRNGTVRTGVQRDKCQSKQIGRASCRERVKVKGGGRTKKEKRKRGTERKKGEPERQRPSAR